jgi:hypothetical protein
MLMGGLAAGGDPKVGRPGKSGRQFGRLADGSKERLTVQPTGGIPRLGETLTLQATPTLLRGRNAALSGAA